MTASEWAFVVTFGCSVLIRGRGERLASRRGIVSSPYAAADAGLIGLMAVGAVGMPAAHFLGSSLAFADYRLPVAANAVGAVAAIMSLWLFWRSHRDLGDNWSRHIAIKTGQALVTTGVYGWVRHPMYLAIWLSCASQALLIHNAVAGWSGMVAFTPMYLYRVAREEQVLLALFGVEYERYRRCVPRHLPGSVRSHPACAKPPVVGNEDESV